MICTAIHWCEKAIRNKDDNTLSVITILNGIKGTIEGGLPALLPKLTIVAFFSRTETEPMEYPANFIFRNNGIEVASHSQNIVFSENSNESNFILLVPGIEVREIGVMTITAMHEGRELASASINLDFNVVA